MDGTTSPTIRETLAQNPVIGTPKSGSKRLWSNRENAILKEHYPLVGLKGCLEKLPGRSASSIYVHAAVLKIAAPNGPKHREKKRKHDIHTDAAITRGYARAAELGRGFTKKLAIDLHLPVNYVRDRAKSLGLVSPRFKEPEWTEAEDKFIKARAHYGRAAIRRQMISAGLTARTETAIVVRLKRLGASTKDLPENLTARGLGRLMGVDSSTVCAWITKGWLKAKPRGTQRTAEQGGDMWTITRKAVREFVLDNVGTVDIRKVEKFWFIDLIANR